ncbi:MAG: hypothetical protein ABFS17_08945 [Chloroflexota bacterium]
MEEFDSDQFEEEIRSSEVDESVETQELDEATFEPAARVEQSQEIEEAEVIESLLTETMSTTESGIAAQPETTRDVDLPESQAQDPLTGKGYGEQSQSENTDSGEDQPEMVPPSDTIGSTPTNVGTVSDTQVVGDEPGSSSVDPGMIDGNEPSYEVDTGAASSEKDIGDGNDPLGDHVQTVDPQRLGSENLPDDKQIPFGEGPDGILVPGGGVGLPGGGKEPPSGGSSSSGGGLPVGGRGGGFVSEEEGKGYHSGKGEIGRWLELKSMKDETPGYVAEPDGKGVWIQEKNGDWYYYETEFDDAPVKTPPQGDPMEGDTPMPYTGGSSGGDADPGARDPIGGPDSESGHFVPVVPQGGDSGGDDGGLTPGDKDGEDDSGHFLGDPNLSGSDDYVPPPDDDIPYNDLNQAKDTLSDK